MTIALSLKVNDGVILAADSASTLMARTPDGGAAVVNVYNNANKIFNLRKGLPIGAITWGAGGIGDASISTLVKDLRRQFKWGGRRQIDPHTYTVSQIAAQFRTFIYEENYRVAFANWPEPPAVGFIVAGYSSGSGLAEEYLISIERGECPDPKLIRAGADSGVTWAGQGDAISRIILGQPENARAILTARGIPEDTAASVLDSLRAAQAQFVVPAMPIQDAIDVAEYLVTLTIQYYRFTPGAPTVGGPVEIAAITKHEGFKWVKRKHYYNTVLNPPDHEEEG